MEKVSEAKKENIARQENLIGIIQFVQAGQSGSTGSNRKRILTALREAPLFIAKVRARKKLVGIRFNRQLRRSEKAAGKKRAESLRRLRR